MFAMVTLGEATRIREHLRHYAHDGRESGSCSGCSYIERHPVIVGWSEQRDISGKQKFLVFEIDEVAIPPLYIVATDAGCGHCGGHTYTDALNENIEYFIKHVGELDPDDRSRKVLALYIDYELSYDIEAVAVQ